MESVSEGCDLYSHTRFIRRHDAIQYRPKMKLYTIPVYDIDDYRQRGIGRTIAESSRPTRTADSAEISSIIGYRPLERRAGIYDSILEIKTSKSNLEHAHVIFDKMMEWLDMGAIEYLCSKRDPSWKEFVYGVLPFVVEPQKPRLCIDGSPYTAVAPKRKLPCQLDTAKQLLQTIRPGMLLSVIDDKSIF